MKFITMITAALVAGFAFGGNCGPEKVKETSWVYKWKFTGKTTESKQVTKKVTTSACSASPQVCSIRVPTSLKIEGYTWMCSPGCGDTFGEVAEVNEVFYTRKPNKFSCYGGVTTEIMHIIGKKAKQVEVGGTANLTTPSAKYKFTYAGLGKYDKKKSRLRSASGNFAGFFDPCECASSAVWNCDTLTLCCESNPTSVVYGKWSVKFMKSASKRFLKEGKLPKYPSWARILNAE